MANNLNALPPGSYLVAEDLVQQHGQRRLVLRLLFLRLS
jgi:hypothetical protein